MATDIRQARPELPPVPTETKTTRGLGVNRVTLVGRLTADPEMHFSDAGMVATNMRLATNERDEPEFHTIVAFGKLGETCGQHLKKGRVVYLEGRIHTRNYETRTGAKKSVEVIAENMQFLDSKGEAAPTT